MMTTEMANRVYDVLVEECQANDDEMYRDMFVRYHTSEDCLFGGTSEWRFQGSLGFGGKFWIRQNRGWDVTYYPEDHKDELDKKVKAANEKLQKLYQEFLQLHP